MKNIVTKFDFYKDISFFNHIYFLDVDFSFNEKTIEEIKEFVSEEPFYDVLIYTNDLTLDVIKVLKEISKTKKIWFETNDMLFEDFGVMQDETMKILGIDNIYVMIDALGDVIDFKKSLKQNVLIKFNYMELPF